MAIPYPFPYQGSKRKLAPHIVKLIPENTEHLIEPFAGAAAISIAAAYTGKTDKIVLNDINVPLMQLWEQIIDSPEELATQYRMLWEEQAGQEKEYYFGIRDKFNKTHRSEYLLFLLVRCVKAAVRYNASGDFNQSPDNRRKGTTPNRMSKQLLAVSNLLRGKVTIHATDYREVVFQAKKADIVYMDPPYQGVCTNRDPRYFEALAFDGFVETLHELNKRQIRYIVSYDGRTGSKTYGKPLPKELELKRLEIDAGRSSQATLLGKQSITFESLYLSPALNAQLVSLSYNYGTEFHNQLRLL